MCSGLVLHLMVANFSIQVTSPPFIHSFFYQFIHSFIHSFEVYLLPSITGKQPPLDHTVVEYIAKKLPTAVIAVMWSFAVFGLAAACFFLYFNIRYRENRLVEFIYPKHRYQI